MLNNAVKIILNILEQHGFTAYAVGGCVRDSLLGKMPKDWDVTTDAHPNDVTQIFENTIHTGIRYGTVSVKIDGEIVEVTTYRGESEYINHRKPKNVYFTKNLSDDLKRRDFTINALCEDKNGTIIDLFDGKKDIQNRIVRAIGIPDERFFEDALRMLRAVRFACRLHFFIEEETLAAMNRNRHLLQKISVERIKAELDQIVLFEDGIRFLIETNLMEEIFRIENFMLDSKTYSKLPKNTKFIYTYLLLNAPNYGQLLNDLKFDNTTKKFVNNVIRHFKDDLSTDYHMQKLFRKVGTEALLCVIILKADDDLEKRFRSTRFMTIKDLSISGNDLLFLPEIHRGKVLEDILDKVFLGELDNNKEILLEFIKINWT